MKNVTILLFLLIFGLSACNYQHRSKVDAAQNQSADDTLKKSDNLSTQEDESSDFQCMRAMPEPIVNKTIFPKTIFQLAPDSLSALETVDFENGDRLIIEHFGCEYFSLKFRFETSRFNTDTTDIAFWYKKTVILVSELLQGLHKPKHMRKGIKVLSEHIEKDQHNDYRNLRLGEEIDYGDTDFPTFRDFLIIESIQKLTDKKCAVEITFSSGPL